MDVDVLSPRRRQKVKTGCKTCKLRRIKCDEGKPSCNKCLSSGRLCAGYGIWDEGRASPIQCTSLSKLNTPIPPMASQEEMGHFDFFRVIAASKLAGAFPSSFWESLVFQASSSELVVLHGASALGAAYKSRAQTICDGMLQNHASADVANRQDQGFAVKQHAKVLDMLQMQLPRTEKRLLRSGLIVCVLATAFELVQGNHKAAATHLRNGFVLVRRAQNCGYEVEPDLAEPLTRAYMRSMLIEGSRSLSDLTKEAWISTEMPKTFGSFREARRHLDMLLIGAVRLSEDSESDNYRCPGDIHQLATLERASSAWIRAYEASLQDLLSQPNHRTIYGVFMLRMFHTMASIMISTTQAPHECAFDKHIEQFASIIDQTLKMWNMNGFAVGGPFEGHRSVTGPRVTFDLGIISPLYYTAVKCRNPRLRRQAIGLLTVAPYREGIWSSVVVAKIARVVVDMEENGFYAGVQFEEDSLAPTDPERYGSLPILPEANKFCTVRVSRGEEAGGRGILSCKKASRAGLWVEGRVEFDFADEL
ncbi:Zn(2)-C6 fungal-type domain-containing protein [Fusarium falciforme]|uniref:Zn(2)-C6 fungal-type domain-containing protein n=1 Tax=Fusarium falciforme TaxID=195108 RepID=UPI002300DE3D|nr:Zn(2)-C6 fungal-type domain-containing protein [Fusarium falciforme]WAO89297.1 Zn(2)-C6 fungal-type domain-containing protein [Fusarium falciforme]